MLKLNVGWSRKAGEANYGSRGASVHLELEVEAGLVNQPGELQDRIRKLFRLAKESVDQELNENNGAAGAGQHGQQQQRPSNGRRATASQVRAINAIADRNRVDLVGLLRDRFQLDRLEDLSISEASSLIDELKGAANGNGARR